MRPLSLCGIGLAFVLAGCNYCCSSSEAPTQSAAEVAKKDDCPCCDCPSRESLLAKESQKKEEAAPVALKTVKFDAFMKDVKGHKGKVVVAYAWASASAPSKKNLPVLLELQRKHKDVVFVTVSMDPEKSSKETLKTLEDAKCNVVNYLQDEKDPVEGWASCFGCCGFPTLVVMDRNGKKAATIEVTELPFDAATIEKTLVKVLDAK
ncbi:MAG: TlpA family protein disulfide reductase [Planctomycetes bacterium]|nr:TlpA family protein disulfide reductase [Planctomycetota bacterium]